MIKKTLLSLFSLCFTLVILYSFYPTPIKAVDPVSSASFCNFTPNGQATGDVSLGNTNCVVYESVNGVAAGDLNLNSSVITLYRDLVWSPGYAINVGTGLIYVNTNARMLERKICYKDSDGDGIPALKSLTGSGQSTVGPSGEVYTGTVLQEFYTVLSSGSPTFGCTPPYVLRDQLTTLSYFDSNDAVADTGTQIGTADNQLLSMGFTINGVADANAAAGDVVVPTGKNLIVTDRLGVGTTNPGYDIDMGSTTKASQTALNINAAAGYQTGVLLMSAGTGTWHMYRPGNTTDLRFYDHTTAGDKVTFKTGGNVGIGTTNPGNRLHVFKTVTTNGENISLIDAGSPSPSGVYGGSALKGTVLVTANSNQTTSTTNGYLSYYAGSDGGIGSLYDPTVASIYGETVHHSGSTNYMDQPIGVYGSTRHDNVSPIALGDAYASHTENVTGVLGTVSSAWNAYGSPGTNSTYRVAGVIGSSSTSGTARSYGGYFNNSGTATTQVGVYGTASGGTNNYAAIFDAGNVGIGTTGPREKLDVTGNMVVDWVDGRRIGMQYLTGTDYFNGLSFLTSTRSTRVDAFSADSTSNILFRTGTVGSPSEKMRITYGGNVGIGTTAPWAKLEVAQYTLANGPNLILNSGMDNGSDYLAGLLINVNGGSGGGTTVTAVRTKEFTSEAYGLDFSTYNNGSLTSSMVILGNGNVGIGTTAPSTGLDVAQNKAIKVGQAYISSGGDYMHLANNEWFNGTTWVTNGYAGAMIQFVGQTIGFFRHDTVGGHTTSFTIDSGGYLVGPTGPAFSFLSPGGEAKYFWWGGSYGCPVSGGKYYCHIFYNQGDARAHGTWISGGIDYAERFTASKDEAFEKGDLVSSTQNTGESFNVVTKSKSSYELNLIGVVSTKPSILGGDNLTDYPDKAQETNGKYYGENDGIHINDKLYPPIALLGQVPVKVTTTNGNISQGDYIASSKFIGIGMKSTQAGYTVGKALDSFAPNRSNCPTVNNLDSIVWPEDKDGRNASKPCFRLADGTFIGKIMVLISPSWYDPDIALASTDGFKVVNDKNNDFAISSKDNALIERIGAYSKIIVAKINAGVIETQKLVIDGIDIMKKITLLEKTNQDQQEEINLLKIEIENIKSQLSKP